LVTYASLILPYAVLEKSREKKFDRNMEFAAIICLAEEKRKTPEKISFISKLHYPLWAIPWKNGCLIIDGLHIFYPTFTYMTLPDLESFLNDIEYGRKIRNQFLNALDKHAVTFNGFQETSDITMKSIIFDKELLSDILDYVKETIISKTVVTEKIVVVPPKFDKTVTGENAKIFFDLYDRIQYDIDSLEHSAETLKDIMHFHRQKILHEIELVNEFLREKIDEIEPAVEKKIENLLKERDAKIKKITRVAEGELNARLREKERRKRELEKLEFKRAEYRARLGIRKDRHDKVGIKRWEQRLRTCEDRISEIKKILHNLSKYVQKISRQNQEDVRKLKYKYQPLIDIERKKIENIKASQESITKAKGNEDENLQFLASRIVGLIEQLKEQKSLRAAELESFIVLWQMKETTLLCVPFYIAGCKTETKFFYDIYPPLRVMNTEGIVKRIEKALLSFSLGSRIKLLLQPRSKALCEMINLTLEEKIQADKIFEENLQGLCASNNLLTSPDFKEKLNNGLEKLKTEKWIKEEESSILIEKYT